MSESHRARQDFQQWIGLFVQSWSSLQVHSSTRRQADPTSATYAPYLVVGNALFGREFAVLFCVSQNQVHVPIKRHESAQAVAVHMSFMPGREQGIHSPQSPGQLFKPKLTFPRFAACHST